MPLTRKTRVSGKSIVVALPSQIVEAYNIKQGDLLEIIPSQDETIVIRKTTIASSKQEERR